jgi:outer membrane protein TolC
MAQIAEQSSGDRQEKVRELSLKRALSLAESNNYEVRKAQKAVKVKEANFRKTNATFLPQISLEERGVTTTDPLNTFGFTLKQEAISEADFSPARLNDPDRTDFFSTQLTFKQPLVNVDGMLQREAMNHKRQASEEKLNRTRYHTRFKIKKTYYRLSLLEERVNVLDSALGAARAHRKQARDYMEQGMINRADFLAAEVRVLNLENDLSEARNHYRHAQEQLRYQLGIEEAVKLKLTDSLQKGPQPPEPSDIDQVNRTRSDMQALKHRVKASQAMLNASQMKFLPSINAMGRYGLYDDNPFGSSGQNYMVGVSLKWDLFKGFENVAGWQESQAILEKAKIARRQQANQNRVQIKDAYRSAKQALERIEKSQASVQQASENLQLRADQYNQGMGNTTDLLDAEVKLQKSRMRRLKALYTYNVNLARLELLLEKNL